MTSRRPAELPVITLAVRNEADVVLVRQRARLVAELLGFGIVDQTRIATAVSEIARNAVQHGRGGRARFLVTEARPQFLLVRVDDSGPGMGGANGMAPGSPPAVGERHVGIALARRLMDGFDVASRSGGGTVVELGKRIPARTRQLGAADVGLLVDELLRRPPESLLEELHQQQQELLAVLENLSQQQDALRRTNAELEETNRGVLALHAEIAHELDDTNRGVLALYAQLDDQAEELRRVNALKDRFLYYLSHEFRTPLNSTLAISRLLLDRSDGPLTGEQEIQVRFIRQGAGDLLEMVNDLLDLAKIEAGRMDLRPEPVDLAELLGTLRGMFRPLAAEAGLTLNVQDPSAELPLLHTDRRKLSQILRNLVGNAIKYTEQGEVTVLVDSAGGSVVFTVADTGTGIAPEDVERIFQEFMQAEPGRRRPTQGTGLGLPLSRRLAILLGGAIDVRSTLGVGSTFRLTLPLRRPAEPAPLVTADVATVPSASSQRHAERDATSPYPEALESNVSAIVVIDPDPAGRDLLEHTLAGAECDVLHAPTAAEGLRLARQHVPVALFLNLDLQDRPGFEVLRELGEDATLRHIPIVLYGSRKLEHADDVAMSGLLRLLDRSDPSLTPPLARIGDALIHAGVRPDPSEHDT